MRMPVAPIGAELGGDVFGSGVHQQAHDAFGAIDVRDARVVCESVERVGFAREDALDDLAIGFEIVDRPFEHEAAAIDHGDALGGAFDLADLMRREDHRMRL